MILLRDKRFSKAFSENLNLTSNKHAKFSKLCLLSSQKILENLKHPIYKILRGPLKLFSIFLEGGENSMMPHTENLKALLT